MLKEIPITAITIGPRFRTDLGDIAGLASSIEQMGLLHPIIVTTEYALIVGQRRLEAHKHLGRTTIEARVVDLDRPLEAEFDENERRKDLNPSEKVAIAEALYEHQQTQAKERQREAGKRHGRGKIASGNMPEAIEPCPEARDVAGAALGWSGRTYAKARAVVEAAKEEPDLQELVELMDRTGSVTRAYNKLPPYARKQPDDDELPRALRPPQPMQLSTMQLKLDAVVMNTIMPRLYQLDEHEVAHLLKLLRFYLELIEKERTKPELVAPHGSVPATDTPGEAPAPAPEEEPAPEPQDVFCMGCNESFATAEAKRQHRAQTEGRCPVMVEEERLRLAMVEAERQHRAQTGGDGPARAAVAAASTTRRRTR